MHRTPEGSAMPHTWQGAGAPAAEMGDAVTLEREFGQREKPPALAVITTRMEADRRRWWLQRALIALVGSLLMAWLMASLAWPAAAQMMGQACDKTEAIDAQLATRFREFPVAFGVSKRGDLIKI